MALPVRQLQRLHRYQNDGNFKRGTGRTSIHQVYYTARPAGLTYDSHLFTSSTILPILREKTFTHLCDPKVIEDAPSAFCRGGRAAWSSIATLPITNGRVGRHLQGRHSMGAWEARLMCAVGTSFGDRYEVLSRRVVEDMRIEGTV